MPKISPADSRTFRFNVGHQFGVDATTGNLTGLQLLAAGREAKGHGIYIDEKTIVTAAAAAAERGGRIKAYVTHNHGGAARPWENPSMDAAASELNIPGFFSGIVAKKSQLVASQFEFFEAFKKNFAPQYEQLLEMAKKTPDLLGISIECIGFAVYVGADGKEYGLRPDGVELAYDGLPALRITELWAAAFVAEGAATEGLYAKLSAVFGGKRSTEERRAVTAALVKFAAEYGAEENTVPVPPISEPISLHAFPPPEISTMKIIADLKAKYGAEPKKFGAAMLILGHKPDITMEALEAQMVQEDFAAVRAEVTTLAANLATSTTELTAANAKIAALTADRDDYKKKFEALKGSGLGEKHDLGAASAGAGNQENPWLKATKNLTAQAKIQKSNPALAATMKAAAEVENAK